MDILLTDNCNAKQNEWKDRCHLGKRQLDELAYVEEKKERNETRKKLRIQTEDLLDYLENKSSDKKAREYAESPRGRKATRKNNKYTRWDLNPRSRSTGS